MAFGRLKVDELETSTQVVNVDAIVGIAADGDKGDITVSGSGTVWTIDDGAVDTAALGGDITAAGKALLDDADAAAQRTTLGAEAAGTAASTISAHEAAADPHPGYALESDLGGAALLDVGTTAGTVAAGDDSRLTTDLGYTASTRVLSSSTGADVTLPLFTSTAAGLAPLSGGGTSNFLRADGTWAAPATGGTPGGTTGQIQWNSAGSFAGVSGSTVGATGNITLSLNGTASTPPFRLTGTWFTGGTTITTKPHFLIEPAGTTSTAWSTSGTGLGINAPSEFAGNLLDLQVNGTSQLSVSSLGSPLVGLTSAYNSGTAKGYYFASGQLSIRSTGTGIGVYSRVNNYPGFYFGTNGPGSGHRISSDVELGWSSTSVANDVVDLILARDAANTLAQRRSTNAQTFRCYGTFTDASNYVRAALSSTSTAVTLAAETAGTGADDIPLNLTAAGTGTVKVNSVAEVAASSTVAGLPATPAVGMLTRVTDANSPAVGSTVTGGGAAAALVWWNGSNWTVIGA